jgi:antitoxin MazE
MGEQTCGLIDSAVYSMQIHMSNETRVSKWGNSLAVWIPQAIVRDARLTEGDKLSLDLADDGSIVLRSRHRKYTLNELVTGIKPANRHNEMDWGAPQGKESW